LRNHSEAQCRPLLSTAFAYGREHEFTIYPCWLAPKMSELCGVAVRHGIESEYTARLIRLRNLVPDATCAFRREWPFPVKIYTLGRFSVLLENESLRFSGKAPKKPLELLRGLIAFGGRRVSESSLAMALWPQASDPMQALATTLHRLRKLIGEHTIERQDGHLGLNSSRVWLDVWALEEELGRVAGACKAKDAAALGPLIDYAAGLYGGGFLDGEVQAPTADQLRERLRSRLVRQIDAAANVMAEAGRHADACTLCQKALEIDPVSEALYLRLMQCYELMGRTAEALLAYERCRSILRKHFGTAPSARTDALARQLRTIGPQSVADL
jgi:two-component SAPR family response regulator